MKLKIAVGVSILSFFIIATATLASYFVIKERNEHNPNLLSQVQSDNSSPNPTAEPSGLTTAKIAEHNSATDCWIIISSKVYNVTKFLDLHPGGGFTITPYCGKDATNAFSSKDRNPAQSHSQTAVEMLKQYYVGGVGSNTTNSVSDSVSKFTLSTNKPVATIVPVRTNTPAPVTLSTAEIATHNTTSSCWLIISNNVYNVTNYLVAHPGGVSVVTSYCGKEATQAFQTQGGRGSHSSTAYSLLNNYLIGSVGSTITTSSNTSSGSTGGGTTPTTQPNNNQSSNVPSAVLSKYPNATLKSIEDDGRELEVNTSAGCRHIKLNSSGAITSDQSC